MRKIYMNTLKTVAGLFIFMAFLSCSTAYYRTMEAFGIHKRDLLVKNVEQARDSQEEAGEQFRTALEKFSEVVGFEGGQLQEKYETLKSEYERSEDRAARVRQRIADVEEVAGDLFQEWEKELEEYSSRELRRSSEKTLRETRRKYDQLIAAMKQAESKMPPVLARLKDNVLFLKHNLNAQAIASLQGTASELEEEVEELLEELEQSISEANRFIDELL